MFTSTVELARAVRTRAAPRRIKGTSTSDLDDRLSEAQGRVESPEEDTEERRQAERDVRWWEALKEVAGGS
jgi:hypothetical protein